MIAYSREEIFPASHAAKKFGDILKKLKNKTLSRIAVSKNNTIEAVILPVEEYEKIQELAEWTEMKEIETIIRERKDSTKTYSLEEVLKENGIDYNAI
ncbi:MAG: type II toxin-antitoxin system prevent-host-death family antitoxin [bacterium]|nr:type II toxin-antitoxin system prevent-host-death family antitoxin [bacterium]